MKDITMPLPPIDTLNLSIDTESFCVQYMRFLHQSIKAIHGIPLYYEAYHLFTEHRNRFSCSVNLSNLPSPTQVQAHFKNADFMALMMEGINSHKQNGTIDCPTITHDMLVNGDMREWPKGWVSVYFWLVMKLSFTEAFGFDAQISNTDYLPLLVDMLCKQKLPSPKANQAAELTALKDTHLDKAAYRDIVAKLTDSILKSEVVFDCTEVGFKDVYGRLPRFTEPMPAIESIKALITTLVQDVKEDDTFFEPDASMRTIKLPLPPLSSLAIECTHIDFAESVVLFISEQIKCKNYTRLHYKNVRVIDDTIYFDVNLARFPVLTDADEYNAVLNAINHNPISGTADCPIMDAHAIDYYDPRKWCTAWLSYGLFGLTKAYYIDWYNKPANLSDERFINNIICDLGYIQHMRYTLADAKAREAIEISDEYGGDHRAYLDIAIELANEVIEKCGPTNISFSEGLSRELSSSTKNGLIDKYTDKVMDEVAEYLLRLKTDDNAIKYDDYYM